MTNDGGNTSNDGPEGPLGWLSLDWLASALGPPSRGSHELFSPAQVERLFSVMEDATRGHLTRDERDRLLGVLEAAIVDGRIGTDELDNLLSLVERTVTSASAEDAESEAALDLLEAAIADPRRLAGTGPEDARSVLDATLANPEAAAERGLDGVFDLLSTLGVGVEGSRKLGTEDGTDPFRIARIAAAASQRATGYSVRSGVRIATQLVQAVLNAQSVAGLVDDARDITFDELRRLGIDVGEPKTPALAWAAHRQPDKDRLREATSWLLEQSADIDYEEPIHPAFTHILEQLAADEARVLRLLATTGDQPAITVRDRGSLPLSSSVVAGKITMIGINAGVSDKERMPVYLDNLERLGLLAFSTDSVDDLKQYQVLEAQPDVEAAVETASWVKLVRHSVSLTAFGREFCDVCLPTDGGGPETDDTEP
jgi:hypothetical protein